MKVIFRQVSKGGSGILDKETWALELWDNGKLKNSRNDYIVLGGTPVPTKDTIIKAHGGYVYCIADVPHIVFQNFGKAFDHFRLQYDTDVYIQFLEPIKCTVLL